DVTAAGRVLVGEVRVQDDTDRLGVFHYVEAVADIVMPPSGVKSQVDNGKQVAVIQGRTQAVTPGEVGEVTVILTPAVRFGRSALRRTGAISKGALTEQGVTTELGLAVTGTDTTDVVETYLTDQGQTAGTQDTVD